MEIIKKLKVNHGKIDEDVKNNGYNKTAEKAGYTLEHPDWQLAAGILEVLEIQRKVGKYRESVEKMKEILDEKFYEFVTKNMEEIEKKLEKEKERDYRYDYFAITTLKKGYMCTFGNEILETPQYMWMRVACHTHCGDLEAAFETYDAYTQGYCIPASPTIANSGFKKSQGSSCFMLSLDDSLESILDNYKLCGMISKYKGGLGIGVGRIRHSKIGRTGMSKGIVDMLRCYNELMRYVDQEGMRKGAATVFYPAWGKDIRSLIEMKKNHGKEELRARDLNYCVWIQDLFMKRVILNQNWTLFCPNLAPGLNDCYGDEFEKLYTSYENDPNIEKFTISARQLLEEICRAQKESSAPFIMFDDAVNMKCNQNHLGHITNSNLCLEVTLFNKPDELVASCNLSTIVLDSYVEYDENLKPFFNYDKLKIYVKLLVRNINNIINKNFYVSDLIKRSNDLYAPLGIGKLGVANLAAKLNLDFDSEEFIVLMETICACMYHSALQESRDIAIKKEKLASDDEKLLYKHNLDLYNQGLGPRPDPIGSFSSFSQSPLGNGLFQFDLWKLEDQKFRSYPLGSLYDKIKRTETLIPASAFNSDESWDQLRLSILTHGVANSTLMCGMPNATTAQIVPNNILGRMVRRNESHEPFHTNLYLREVLSGAFPVYTCELVSDLESLGLWNKSTLNFLMKNKGSVKGLSLLFPNNPSVLSIEQKYRTGFELSQKRLIELVARMGRYICMSQSHNIRLEDPDVNQLFNLHIYSWLMGQKTGMYYLHQRSAVDRQQFTLSDLPPSSIPPIPTPTPVSSPSSVSSPLYTDPSLTSEELALASMICRRDNPDCASCQ